MIPRHPAMLGTFDVRASASVARPDELLFDCSKLPPGSTLALYFPAADAGALLASAASKYGKNTIFAGLDAHTIETPARGFVYLPLPVLGGNLAGLMAVVLPAGLHAGKTCQITVSQITTRQEGGDRNASPLAAEPPLGSKLVTWRQTSGLFTLKTTIAKAAAIVPKLERNYMILLWIFSGMPASSRWFAVFERYLAVMAAQIDAVGGNARLLPGNANGDLPNGKHGDQPPTRARPLSGKIEGLMFDHFGDFEGFILTVDSGETFHFHSRETPMRAVCERAWEDRLRVTVFPGDDDHVPLRLVLHPPTWPI